MNVHQYDVVRPSGKRFEGLAAITDRVHRVAQLAQKSIGQHDVNAVVLGNEYAQAPLGLRPKGFNFGHTLVWLGDALVIQHGPNPAHQR